MKILTFEKKYIVFFLIAFFYFPFLFSQTSVLNKKGQSRDADISAVIDFMRVEFPAKIKFTVEYPWTGNLSFTQNFNFYKPIKGEEKRKAFINLSIGTEVSLGTAQMNLGAQFFPVSFADFFTEFKFGTGWSFPKIQFYGLAENSNSEGRQKIVALNFSKTFIFFATGLNIYFKLSDIIKNDWSKLKIGTGQFITYSALLPFNSSKFWFYKNDEGENRNGSIYKASYFIEYKMPLYINTIKFGIDTQRKLYKPLPESKNLSEALWIVQMAVEFIFGVNNFVNISLESVWLTSPMYAYSDDNTFFTEKILNYPKKQTLYFKKVTAAVILKL